MDFVMRFILKKIYRRLGHTAFLPLLAATVAIFLAAGSVNMVSAQTNLQELQLLIKELESKLADATRRQERAYNVQMQLEEQEQRLAELEKTEAYKIQTIQIRADIQNIRTRIEAINKEKTDLEENLRVARSMQTILSGAQPEAKPVLPLSPVRPGTQSPPEPAVRQAKISPTPQTQTSTARTDNWYIKIVRLSPYFSALEQDTITSLFKGDQQMSRDDLMRKAYQTYARVGVIVELVVQPATVNNTADLEIRLRRRDCQFCASHANSWVPSITRNRFENREFQLTVK
jgi:cell division protein FtsL